MPVNFFTSVRPWSRRRRRSRLDSICAVALLFAGTVACGAPSGSTREVVRITGSDTMVNLLQAWAEHYARVRPGVSVQVAGGGSGVGIAGLIDGTLDIAAASREMRPEERRRVISRYGVAPAELTVALDALAVYVHRTNPIGSISITELAEVYAEGGRIDRWRQLGARHWSCRSDEIIRVSRQNNSGTFAYFRQVVLGPDREYRLGSIDQSGSKDVVSLVSNTPCAVGYSGIAFATPGVRTLELATTPQGPAIAPSEATVADGSYPLARRLYLYTAGHPSDAVTAFTRWTVGPQGQTTVRQLRLVPVAASGRLVRWKEGG
jgi:phosphate transport system substrate-binding protein